MATEQEKIAYSNNYEERIGSEIVSAFCTEYVTISKSHFVDEIRKSDKLLVALENLLDEIEISDLFMCAEQGADLRDQLNDVHRRYEKARALLKAINNG